MRSSLLLSSSRFASLAWVSLSFLLSGCAGKASESPADRSTQTEGPDNAVLDSGECHTDAECEESQRCVPGDGAASRRFAFAAPGAAAPPLPCGTPDCQDSIAEPPDPCSFVVQCQTDEECGDSNVCQAPTPQSELSLECPFPQCQVSCQVANSCVGPWDRCSEDGHCVLARCDEPDFPGCPETMVCDPSYDALADPTVPLGRYSPTGVAERPNLQETTLAPHAGCVFRLCDDPAASPCADNYRCEADAEATITGCVPIPCSESGQCSSSTFICEPFSDAPRPGTVDGHGCVSANCEEIPTLCPATHTCDFTREGVSPNGCAPLRCNEPNGACLSPDYQACDPEAEGVDLQGCRLRRCVDGEIDCAAVFTGTVCEPDHLSANAYGCVNASLIETPPTNPNGGNGGTAPQTMGGAGGTVVDDPTAGSGGSGVPNPNPPAPPPSTTQSPPVVGPSTGGNGGQPAPGPLPSVRPDGAEMGASCARDVDCRTGYCVQEVCSMLPGQCR